MIVHRPQSGERTHPPLCDIAVGSGWLTVVRVDKKKRAGGGDHVCARHLRQRVPAVLPRSRRMASLEQEHKLSLYAHTGPKGSGIRPRRQGVWPRRRRREAIGGERQVITQRDRLTEGIDQLLEECSGAVRKEVLAAWLDKGRMWRSYVGSHCGPLIRPLSPPFLLDSVSVMSPCEFEKLLKM